MSILIFIIILVALILVHEFGHFIIAKKSGIRVDEFGIGFPPKLFGIKKGETEYSFNLLPFGGFVKIFGEDPGDESIAGPDKDRSFVHKPKYIQAAVLIAGVGFNVLFAWFLFSVGFMVGVPAALDDGRAVTNPELIIMSVLPESPAAEAGLEIGDKVVRLESGKLSTESVIAGDVSDFILEQGVSDISITFERGEEVVTTSVTPTTGLIIQEPDKTAIGITMGSIGTLKLPPHTALWEGGKMTIQILVAVTVAILSFLGSALTLSADLSQIAGPVGIVGIVGDAASFGFSALLSFTALISLNLAVINLLPFPALDGGRLVFVLVEKIKGSPVRPAIVNALNRFGFALLILLLLVVTYNDIVRIAN